MRLTAAVGSVRSETALLEAPFLGGPGGLASVDLARWAAHRFAQAVRLVDDAEQRQRRAVWGLLCGEQPVAAVSMAEAIGTPLAPVVRVLSVVAGGHPVDGIVTLVRRTAGSAAWIVRAGSDEDPVVVLLTADGPDTDDSAARHIAATLRRVFPRCRVGASPIVDLARAGGAYAQAQHALNAAHVAADGYARFHAWLSPELLMTHHAGPWARESLAPLAAHRPRRHGDPTAAELVHTLERWLADRRGAGESLGIHRNTLSGRLRLVERLLGRDLRSLPDRAELSLALRVTALLPDDAAETTEQDVTGPVGPAGPTGKVPRLPLNLPALEGWAHAGLRPLSGGLHGADARTLRVWLAHDGRLAPTAQALSLTVPGARKRLTRIGRVLGLDLLHGPTAQADLWLALRVVDRLRSPTALTERRRAS